MLHPIELVPSHRAALRRGVRLGCELTTNLHGPRRETVVDLSAHGARVITDLPLTRGEHVLIGFAPEGLGRRVETIARVAHVDREPIAKPSVGLEFEPLDPDLRQDISARLRNVPPPLPARRTKPRTELVWLDVLVTWEENLGDRVNTFEVSDTLAAIDDGELVIETLAPFITGGRGEYRWLH